MKTFSFTHFLSRKISLVILVLFSICLISCSSNINFAYQLPKNYSDSIRIKSKQKVFLTITDTRSNKDEIGYSYNLYGQKVATIVSSDMTRKISDICRTELGKKGMLLTNNEAEADLKLDLTIKIFICNLRMGSGAKSNCCFDVLLSSKKGEEIYRSQITENGQSQLSPFHPYPIASRESLSLSINNMLNNICKNEVIFNELTK